MVPSYRTLSGNTLLTRRPIRDWHRHLVVRTTLELEVAVELALALALALALDAPLWFDHVDFRRASHPLNSEVATSGPGAGIGGSEQF